MCFEYLPSFFNEKNGGRNTLLLAGRTSHRAHFDETAELCSTYSQRAETLPRTIGRRPNQLGVLQHGNTILRSANTFSLLLTFSFASSQVALISL